MTRYALAALLLLTGCAESLDHFHRGDKIVERHYMPGSWGIPGNVSYTECRPDQMKHSTFWAKKVCPDSIEPNAPLSVDRGYVSTASYKDLVVPAGIHGLAFLGGMGVLGATMPGTTISQQQSVNALPGARFSTGYFNATPAPSWLGQ
jgi:hypothetical protein